MRGVKKSIVLPEDLYQRIEEYRASKRPIPSFNEAVVELLRRCLPEK